MEDITNFKPMLIPNFKKEKTYEAKIATISSNLKSDLITYYIFPKKDGCRAEIIDGALHSRSFVDKKDSSKGLKLVRNLYLRAKYDMLAKKCKELGIILEGEIFSRDMCFNEICRRFKTEDVKDNKHHAKLSKVDLDAEYYGRDIQWLTSNHADLKLYLFDLVVISSPKCTMEARISLLYTLFKDNGQLSEFSDIVVLPTIHVVGNLHKLKELYNYYLSLGYEGLVLAHMYSEYKQGRATIKQGTIFKLKEDCNEYDGKILRVEQSTVSIGETSTYKEDRTDSGMAKGFIVLYEGNELLVQLKNCPHIKRREIWEDRKFYKDQWITYTGMAPVKNVPRHAFFARYRDDK